MSDESLLEEINSFSHRGAKLFIACQYELFNLISGCIEKKKRELLYATGCVYMSSAFFNSTGFFFSVQSNTYNIFYHWTDRLQRMLL